MLITRYGCLLYLLNSCIKVASFFPEDFISHKLFVKKKNPDTYVELVNYKSSCSEGCKIFCTKNVQKLFCTFLVQKLKH